MKIVATDDFGIKGTNFYWDKGDSYNISKDELKKIGINDGKAYVREEIIPYLLKANEDLKKEGYELIIKDAYRSEELYALIRDKRYAIFGKEETDKILNTIKMPHSSGKAIDVSLIDLNTLEEVMMRDKKDDPDAFFIDYYIDKRDEKSKEYQRLQQILVSTMLKNGFKLGSLKEYWHFEIDLP